MNLKGNICPRGGKGSDESVGRDLEKVLCGRGWMVDLVSGERRKGGGADLIQYRRPSSVTQTLPKHTSTARAAQGLLSRNRSNFGWDFSEMQKNLF